MSSQQIFGLGLLLVILSTLIISIEANTSLNFPACDVFCHGELLDTIQMSNLFKDSKTFVDLKLRNSPNETLNNFQKFMKSKNNKPTNDDLKNFINKNFQPSGKEFAKWTPNDWHKDPKFLDSIKNSSLKQWGKNLHRIWKNLGRKMIDDVFKKPDYYSIIPVKNPVIVPGGRFIEFYYWDSYWIIRGLLHSEMYKTARGMLSNFLSIIRRFGFIPNGGRIYYAKRSQPPLLAAMIESYVEFTKDKKFALDAVEFLEKEFHYWMKNNMININGHALAIYRDMSKGPRPESYREDVQNAEIFPTPELKQAYYSNIAAGAESGMDFSSRWSIDDNGTNQGGLRNIKCRSIVPVDLNAILFWNAEIIAKFYFMANNVEKAAEYTFYAQEILKSIEAVLWNEEAGVWLDYDLINKRPRNYFVTSNLAPLWTKAYNVSNTDKISESVLKYIEKLGLSNHPGGVPNTLEHSGEQWDFPNVWPPMQYILVQGLENLNTTGSLELSKLWGHRWVKSNYEAYKTSNNSMFEKYDSEVFGGHGGGGEYDVQTGFGWTNGVIIDFLVKYGHEISPAN